MFTSFMPVIRQGREILACTYLRGTVSTSEAGSDRQAVFLVRKSSN